MLVHEPRCDADNMLSLKMKDVKKAQKTKMFDQTCLPVFHEIEGLQRGDDVGLRDGGQCTQVLDAQGPFEVPENSK